jgi:hypothetical protein
MALLESLELPPASARDRQGARGPRGGMRVSKESKPRDRWNQVYTAAKDRAQIDFCRGCGYYLVVHGEHRDDCTAEPPAP